MSTATLPAKRPRGRPPGRTHTEYIPFMATPAQADGLALLAGRNETTVSEEVRRAIDAHLRHAGIWPERAD
jgi:hypothetical protein